MMGYINDDGNCGDYEHDKLSAKINSKWGRFYKLDPWYRDILKAHKENCETCKKLMVKTTKEKERTKLHSHSPPQSRAVSKKDNEAVNIAIDSEEHKI